MPQLGNVKPARSDDAQAVGYRPTTPSDWNPAPSEVTEALDQLATTVGPAGTPPFSDANEIVKGSADDTKRLRFEVDGLTTGTTRVVTIQDTSLTIAGIDVTNVFTVVQKIVTAGTAASPPSDVGLLVQRSSVAGANASIEILSGNAGECTFRFADTDASGPGRITYDHATNEFRFYTNNTLALTLTSAQVLQLQAALDLNDQELQKVKNVDYSTWGTGSGTGAQTVDFSTHRNYRHTAGAGDVQITLTAPSRPGKRTLFMKQDGTGGRAFTFTTSVTWVGGSSPDTSDGGADDEVWVDLEYDGTNWFGVFGKLY